jgi:peptide chain release factor 2
MVKDLRTGYEVGDPSRVLDGDLDGFVEAYLADRARKSAD